MHKYNLLYPFLSSNARDIHNSARNVVLELSAWIVCLAFLLYQLRGMLFYGDFVPIHDLYYFSLPLFNFFAQSIAVGHFPYWNPFTHAGEPFYLIPFKVKFLDLSILVIFIGKYFTKNLEILFSWDRLIQTLVMLFGSYIVLRAYATKIMTKIILIPILIFSSMTLGTFRTTGLVHHFLWVPFLFYYVSKILYQEDYRWCNFILAGAFFGLTLQSNLFIGSTLLIIILVVSHLFYRFYLLKKLFFSSKFFLKLLLVLAIVVAMSAPNVILLLERNKYIFPTRMASQQTLDGTKYYGNQQYEGGPSDLLEGIFMPYELVKQTGAFTNLWDFLQVISPGGNRHALWPGRSMWGNASESFLYLGLLTWVFILIGIIFGQHEMKPTMLTLLLIFIFVTMGPNGGIHRLIYSIFPPFWFLRHTHSFMLFVSFFLLYFFVIGLERFFVWLPNNNPFNVKDLFDKRTLISTIIFTSVISFIIYLATHLKYPGILYSWVYIVFLFFFGWAFRRRLGNIGLFIGVVASQILIVFILDPDKYYFALRISIFIFLPFLFWQLLIKSKFGKTLSIQMLSFIVMIIFSVFLVGDLLSSFKNFSYLYNYCPSPSKDHNVQILLSNIHIPLKRYLVAPSIYSKTNIWVSPQSMRYTSLEFRKSYAFSSFMSEEDKKRFIPKYIPSKSINYNSPTKNTLYNYRWNSLLLLKNYFELVNSKLSPTAIEKAMAINNDIYQFRTCAVSLDNDNQLTFLSNLPPRQQIRLSAKYIVSSGSKRQFDGLELNKDCFYKENIGDNCEQLSTACTRSSVNKFMIITTKVKNYDNYVIIANAPSDGFLYWADGYDKWWRAWVNDTKAQIYRANVNFKAIKLARGKNVIQLIYDPIPIRYAIYLFYGTLLVSVIGGFIFSFKGKPDHIAKELQM